MVVRLYVCVKEYDKVKGWGRRPEKVEVEDLVDALRKASEFCGKNGYRLVMGVSHIEFRQYDTERDEDVEELAVIYFS
jgi:hypothetical protein